MTLSIRSAHTSPREIAHDVVDLLQQREEAEVVVIVTSPAMKVEVEAAVCRILRGRQGEVWRRLRLLVREIAR